VVKALEVFNKCLNNPLGKLPGYTTIHNWIKKYGLDVYQSCGEAHKGKAYAEVVDESMMIGSEKLLVTLGIPARHPKRPLRHSDVSMLRMAVSESWTGSAVKDELDKGAHKVGHLPEYVISDNASIMNKGTRLFGVPQHPDISHTLGMYLERTYKNEPDFKEFTKGMSDVKFKQNMKKTAYLLPPTQRVIARFINLGDWVKWSSKILHAYHRLNAEEQSVYSFILSNVSLINELDEVMECVKGIEHICKHQGLSRKSIRLCRSLIKRTIARGNSRMVKLAQDIIAFLNTQDAMLESDTDVRNNSSDIIESVFGTYKLRKSPNKLHGVTSFILFLPAYLQIRKMDKTGRYCIKERLERIRLKDIDDWTKENLTPNLVSKRIETFREVG
jgi:hypothetical protein